METFVRYLIAFLVFIVLVALYFGTYLLNKKTKKPEGCEEVSSGCAHCDIVSCSQNVAHGEDK